ncbi:MAG: guanylate kinase [Blautia sp.]|nr:guanylate kinase [Blautia sp.]
MKDKTGILTVVSGFSGAGKGTIIRRLLEMHPEYVMSVSVTTRDPRKDEVEGESYFFRTREYFEELIEKNLLMEYAEYCGCYYGTPLKFVQDNLAEGRDVLLEIETVGAGKIMQKYPEVPAIFLTPPSLAELENRLRSRKTETEEKIRERIAKACKEAPFIRDYRYIVVNETDKQTECAELIHNIIQVEKRRVGRNTDLVEALVSEAEKRSI